MPATTFRKADSRYYVSIDGIVVGWVCKGSDGWTFYATVREALKGERLSVGRTRNEAIWDGIGTLRIRHYGRVFILSHETWKDETVYFDEATLRAVEDDFLGRMYPNA